MLAWLRKLARVEILIAVASVVFGLLISPVFEKVTSPLFDTPARAKLAGLFFLALLAIISIVTVGVFAKRHEIDTAKVSEELSSINRRMGLTVRFVRDPLNRSTGEVYRTTREMLEKAEKEILHFYYCRPPAPSGSRPKYAIETEALLREREKYMQTIIDKIQQHKGDRFFYRKIFQFPEGGDTQFTESRVGKRWFDNTKLILGVLDDYPDAAVIKKAPLFLQQTFFIVDERYGMWAIDAIDPEHSVRYYEGALFFDDPRQEFIGYLKGFFLRVDAHATIVRKIPEE